MPKPLLDDYVSVAERITAFKTAHPEGSLQSKWNVTTIGDKTFVVCEARAYRTADDARPGEGLAWEVFPGPTPYTRNSELMNAQTSAWGRAIAALGFEVRKGIATGDEIRNAEERKQDDGPPPQRMKAPTYAEVEARRAEVVKASAPTSSVEIEAKRQRDAKPGKVSDADYGRLVAAGAKVKDSDPDRYVAFNEWVKQQGGWGTFVMTGNAKLDEALAILEGPSVAEQVAAFAPAEKA